MQLIKKIVLVFLFVCLCVACSEKSSQVYLEKEGQLYEIADWVSFYYPKNFEFDHTQDKNNKFAKFIHDDEDLIYVAENDDADNKIEDMSLLYGGQLEEDGAKDVVFHHVTLDSGIECYEYTGIYSSSGIEFKHIVYFTDETTYTYLYQAPSKIYQENINKMTQYLRTLTVHHEIVS
jgi:hypothetical protein